MTLPAEEIIIELETRSSDTSVTIYTSKGGVREKRALQLPGISGEEAKAFLVGIDLMAQAFNAQLKSVPEDKISGLVSMLIPQKPASPGILREAKLLAKGKTRILHSGDWMTAQEVVELAQFKTVNARAQPAKWKRAGKIFALRHEGIDYFPAYGLDPLTGYRPRHDVAEVVTILGRKKDGWGMALWFGSSNSMLAGKLPKDVLKDDPEAVVEAARDEVFEALHG